MNVRSPIKPQLPILLLVLLLAACGGSEQVKGDDLGPPPNMVGFPDLTSEGIVIVTASYTNPALFGDDFFERSGIVPIRLTVQLRGEGDDKQIIILSPDRMNLRLFLPDGTVLGAVPADQAAAAGPPSARDAVAAHAFRGGLLTREITEGQVYFAFNPRGDYQVDGRAVRHRGDGLIRTMDLGASLLAFELTTESERDLVKPFYVGIKN
jgi:hypothetical protein